MLTEINNAFKLIVCNVLKKLAPPQYNGMLRFVLGSKESVFSVFKFSLNMRALFMVDHGWNPQLKSTHTTVNFKLQL